MVLRTVSSVLRSGFCKRATSAGHSSSGYRFADQAGWTLITLAFILIAGCDILDIDVYVEVKPRESTLIAGESTKFTATVYDGYEGLEWKIVWQVEPASLGEIDGEGYLVGGSEFLNTLDAMELGKGYWIHATAYCQWTFSQGSASVFKVNIPR